MKLVYAPKSVIKGIEARTFVRQLHTDLILKQVSMAVSPLKCYYDENHIFSIEAILRHKQVAYVRGKILFTIFKYLFLLQRYSSF